MTDRQEETTNAPETSHNVNNGTTKTGCGQWYLSEVVCHCCTDRSTTSWFGAVDVANGRCIDFTASFQLDASAWVLVVKFLLWGFVLGSFIYAWVTNSKYCAAPVA